MFFQLKLQAFLTLSTITNVCINCTAKLMMTFRNKGESLNSCFLFKGFMAKKCFVKSGNTQ